jgi:tetratricopeptide (TPR) repeat protein
VDRKSLANAAILEVLRIVREVEAPRPSTKLSSSANLPSIAANRSTEPAQLSRLVRGEVDWIVMKCLEKDRTRRYESTSGLVRDIQRYLANEVVEARPASAGYRLRKFVSRHKGQVLAASLVLVALLAGIVGTALGLIREGRANARLLQKNEELAAEKARVEKRFELAYKAIASLHTGVSEDMLLKSDQFKDLRIQLLKQTAEFYGDLEKLLEGQTDAKSRRLLAEGYYQLAELTGKIGSRSESLRLARKALAVRRELAAEPKADVETRLDVVRSLGLVGTCLLGTGDDEKALELNAEQVAVAEALKEESPTEAVLAALAQTYNTRSSILGNGVKTLDALASNEKALEILRELVKTNPSAAELRYDLSRSLKGRHAFLWAVGKWAEALAAGENARDILEKLARDNPTVTKYQSALATAYGDIGSTLSEEGKPAESVAATENARVIMQKLADAHPAVTGYQIMLGVYQRFIGEGLAEVGRLAEAQAAQEKGLAILTKFAEANPIDTRVQWLTSYSEDSMGELLARKGRSGEALQLHEKALARMREQIEAHPASAPDWGAERLGRCLERIGLLLSATGKSKQALAACHEAVALCEKLNKGQPAHTWFKSELASSYFTLGLVQQRAGQPAEAVASVRHAVALVEELPTHSARNYLNLARYQALLAVLATEKGAGVLAKEGEAAAERAVAALKNAIAAGYHAVAELRTDTTLNPLRAREDFKNLLADLEKEEKDRAHNNL